MYNNIDSLPDSSRIWIYQSNRAFNAEELSQINTALEQFVASWNAHGSDLSASFTIEKNQFIIVSVDEGAHAASGCSIDKSVGIIKNIETAFNVNMFDRTSIAFINENNAVEIFKLSEAKSRVNEGTLTPTTKIFDNTIQTLGDFRQRWIVDAENSWLKRYFKVSVK